LVTDEMVDTLAVAGTPDDCRAALRRLADAGLDALIAVVPRVADLTGQLALIGDTLVPFWTDIRCRAAAHRLDARARLPALPARAHGEEPGGDRAAGARRSDRRGRRGRRPRDAQARCHRARGGVC